MLVRPHTVSRIRALRAPLLGLLALACGGGDAPSGEPGPAVMTAVPVAAFVDGAELRQQIDSEEWVVIHVDRSRDGYDEGHIPGARFLDFARIAVADGDIANEFPADAALLEVFEGLGVSTESTVVLTGWPLGAARAKVALELLGLGEQAFLLDGGEEGWERAGGSLTSDVPEVTPGSIEGIPTSRGLIVDAEWIAARLGQDGVALLDARPEAQYTGEDPGTGIERGGHLPGAGHVYWEDLRDSGGALLDRARIQAMFEAAGAQVGDTVVAYCRTGVQAGYLYAVAQELGYTTRLYDASYSDWSARTDLPIEPGGPSE